MNRKRSSRLLKVPVQCLLIILINQLCGTFSPAKIESSALRHFPRTESNEHNEAISKQNFSEEKSSLMQKILDLYRALNRGQLRLVTELYSGFYFDIQIRNNISIENYTESQSHEVKTEHHSLLFSKVLFKNSTVWPSPPQLAALLTADCQTCWNCLSEELSPFDWLHSTFLCWQRLETRTRQQTSLIMSGELTISSVRHRLGRDLAIHGQDLIRNPNFMNI